ncbi:MAG: arginase family protein [Promethearchaeota archaeon]
MEKRIKVFGAALDATDFPLSIQTKHAYLNRLAQNLITEPNFLDPYEGFLLYSSILSKENYLKIGKFPIESWLRPKPNIEDYPFVNQLEFQKFTINGKIKEKSDLLEKFIIDKVFPDIPLMIGVDHSLTGGVLSTLSNKFGSENILVVVFDAHFDGIPASISTKIAKYTIDHPDLINPLVPELAILADEDLNIKDSYNCASFLFYLMEEKILLPENLIIFGCQDYPDNDYRSNKDPRIVEFVNFYDAFEKKGVKFISKNDDSNMVERLNSALKFVDTPYIYVSFDVDVGGLKEIIAARFRNAIGLDKSIILNAGKKIKKYMDLNSCELIGLDIMEIDTHLLSRVFPKSGRIDQTVEVVDEFLNFFI